MEVAEYGLLVATTLDFARNKMMDNFSKNSAFLAFLKSKGSIKIKGGRTIREPIMYGKNPNFKSYDGFDPFSMTKPDAFALAQYDWKHVGGTIPIAMTELLKCQGDAEIVDMTEALIKQGDLSIQEAAYTQLWGDGTGNDKKDIDGMLHVISVSPQTVGGINEVAHPEWANNRYYTTGGPGGLGAPIANFQTGADAHFGVKAMEDVFLALSNGSNIFPDALFFSPATYRSYSSYLRKFENIEWSADLKKVGTGVSNIVFYSQPCFLDIACPGSYAAPPGYIYFINSQFLFFYIHEKRNFVTDEWVKASNQDAKSCMLYLWGNLATNNRRYLGVMQVTAD